MDAPTRVAAYFEDLIERCNRSIEDAVRNDNVMWQVDESLAKLLPDEAK